LVPAHDLTCNTVLDRIQLDPIPDLSAPLSLSYGRTQTPAFGMSASVRSVAEDMASLLLGGSIDVGEASRPHWQAQCN
jgi:hypothetical protein